eukprot:CAMPEP_0204561230 /NCGR_PEP_ID=MMETSP0661-20131031/33056_1 /ASSEMBLY_ACC=CAM_ASM_000606 /TAXON_ID=109239 /ORGANISM="Alexandrium margalefi, Strain AMGDE01CS-322" /LENGTH=334 /DNA_ID=CAMNT_0051568631 /DNA_START=48 /DNA_END=1052 /DNA_ORIENTATION=-
MAGADLDAGAPAVLRALASYSPCIGLEAQRKFGQILFMQKQGVPESQMAQHQFHDDPDALTRGPGANERGPRSASAGLAATATGSGPGGDRHHGTGSHSLMAREGVRSHFHNTASIHSRDAVQGGLSALDLRWEGSHIDHTKLPQHNADAKRSTMAPEERERQFSTHFKTSQHDCAALKAQTASSVTRDVERYRPWRQHEFRSDLPHRHGKHGRRHFDPQVREKQLDSRNFASQIENKPQEECDRHGDRVHDFLHRKLPKGQEKHFQLYLPKSQQPSKYQELATHQHMRLNNSDGVVKRHALGFGQLRHSGPGDLNLYARPLGVSQMDRLIPLA